MTAIPSSGVPAPDLLGRNVLEAWPEVADADDVRHRLVQDVGHANALIIRYLASRNHDAWAQCGGDMKAALAKIQAKVLLLTSQTDRTIPAYLSRELYAGVRTPSI